MSAEGTRERQDAGFRRIVYRHFTMYNRIAMVVASQSDAKCIMHNAECYSVSACHFENGVVPIGFPNVDGLGDFSTQNPTGFFGRNDKVEAAVYPLRLDSNNSEF